MWVQRLERLLLQEGVASCGLPVSRTSASTRRVQGLRNKHGEWRAGYAPDVLHTQSVATTKARSASCLGAPVRTDSVVCLDKGMGAVLLLILAVPGAPTERTNASGGRQWGTDLMSAKRRRFWLSLVGVQSF